MKVSTILTNLSIDQFRSIKIQPKTIDFSTMLWGITTEFVAFIPQSLVLRSNFNISKFVYLFFLTLLHILVLNLSQMCNRKE